MVERIDPAPVVVPIGLAVSWTSIAVLLVLLTYRVLGWPIVAAATAFTVLGVIAWRRKNGSWRGVNRPLRNRRFVLLGACAFTMVSAMAAISIFSDIWSAQFSIPLLLISAASIGLAGLMGKRAERR